MSDLIVLSAGRRQRKRLQADSGPTMQDVADTAGVSIATVSRCLNSPGAVGPVTRAKVEAAIARLGYEQDLGARSLALGRSRSVGAVIPTLGNAIFAAGIQALQRRLAEAGYTLLLASSEYDGAQELEQVRVLLARGIDAMFLIGQDHDPEVFERLARRGVPYVLGWTSGGEPHPCVGFDNAASAARIAAYLVEIGHRRIAMIAGLSAFNDRARQRLEGVRAALHAKGLELPPGRVLERAYTIEDGREAMRAIIAQDPRPTAVICGNDVLAFGALFEAQRSGLVVPRDVSITGFDDLPLAAQLTPPLTTIHVPAELMGRRAADYVLRRLEGLPTADRGELPVNLIVRGSTAPPLGERP
jgi:LacI family transcriptional regulator